MRVRVRAAVLDQQRVHTFHVRASVWRMLPEELWCRETECQFLCQRRQWGVHLNAPSHVVSHAVTHAIADTLTHVVDGRLERTKGGQLGVLCGRQWVQCAKRRQHTVRQRWRQRVQTAVR
jgi:hypothetical protein